MVSRIEENCARILTTYGNWDNETKISRTKYLFDVRHNLFHIINGQAGFLRHGFKDLGTSFDRFDDLKYQAKITSCKYLVSFWSRSTSKRQAGSLATYFNLRPNKPVQLLTLASECASCILWRMSWVFNKRDSFLSSVFDCVFWTVFSWPARIPKHCKLVFRLPLKPFFKLFYLKKTKQLLLPNCNSIKKHETVFIRTFR